MSTGKIGFLGAGKMGEAILAALLKNKLCKPDEVLVCDVQAARRALVRRRQGVAVTASPARLPAECGTIFLAIKPQDLDTALAALAPALAPRHLLISIVAGKTTARLEELAGGRARVARVMPNLNVAVGEGMCAFTLGSRAGKADCKTVARLLAGCGRAIELEECHFDAVTGLSGSGPAFFAYVMEAMAGGAVALGMPADAARTLALQTMLGTARTLLETWQEPTAFIRDVCSPKGTTAAGMAVLEKSSAKTALERTVKAAARRSRELNRS